MRVKDPKLLAHDACHLAADGHAPVILVIVSRTRTVRRRPASFVCRVLGPARSIEITRSRSTISCSLKRPWPKKSNATLKRFPNLNHLFMDGKGKPRRKNTKKRGHVSKEVVDLVADWVLRN